MYKLVVAALVVSAHLASADSLASMVQNRLSASAEAGEDMEVTSLVMGVENCVNKCQKMFATTAFSGQAQGLFPGGFDTYEFSACRVGCYICMDILNTTNTPTPETDPGACMKTCKNTNWFLNVDGEGNPFPIQKGTIEPDKACEMGCIINTCQYVCTGGTPDMTQAPSNEGSWWGQGGCSIKTGAIRPGGFYSQNSQYSLWNTQGAPACCANSYNLCFYQSDPNSENYANVLLMSQNACTGVVSDLSIAGICTYYNNTQNCGSFLGE